MAAVNRFMSSFSVRWVGLLAFIFVISYSTACTKQNKVHVGLNPSAQQIRTRPITIATSNSGDFSQGYSWFLSINSSGDTCLQIETPPKTTVRTFRIPANQMKELREAIITAKFFELKDKYGEAVPSSSTQSIMVNVGQTTKSIIIEYLPNAIEDSDHSTRSEIIRLLVLRGKLRELFEDPEAVDIRKHEQQFLNKIR